MKRLVTTGLRPSLGQASTHPILSPSRRIPLPPSAQNITAADIFTIILPSVLGGAFFLDHGSKLERTRELDRQIAEVDEQCENLRQRQLDAWQRLQHRSVRSGIQEQRRTYFTSHGPAVRTVTDAPRLDFELEMDILDKEWTGSEETRKDAAAQEEADDSQIQLKIRHDRLIATRLGLSLLLHLRTRRVTHFRLPYEESADPDEVDSFASVPLLFEELRKVRDQLKRLQMRYVPMNLQYPSEMRKQQEEMSEKLLNLTTSYLTQEITVSQYIYKYVRLISDYRMGPQPYLYAHMMRALSVQNQPLLSSMAEAAIWQCHQELEDHQISHLLYKSGSDQDLSRLQTLLLALVRPEMTPRPKSSWFEAAIDDMRLPTPTSSSPYLLVGMIRTRMCLEQTRQAEAYAKMFFQRDRLYHYPQQMKEYVLSCFLKGYAMLGSRQAGRSWLCTAVGCIQALAQASEGCLTRVMIRALDFCLVCDLRSEYEFILDNLVHCQFRPPEIDPTKPVIMRSRIFDIRNDWTQRLKAVHAKPSSAQISLPDRARSLHMALKDHFPIENVSSTSVTSHQEVDLKHNQSDAVNMAVTDSEAPSQSQEQAIESTTSSNVSTSNAFKPMVNPESAFMPAAIPSNTPPAVLNRRVQLGEALKIARLHERNIHTDMGEDMTWRYCNTIAPDLDEPKIVLTSPRSSNSVVRYSRARVKV